MIESYRDFIKTKDLNVQPSGFCVAPGALNPALFDWQREVVSWALERGRAALFEDCGLGKTPQQLEWARQVHSHTGGDVLILAPLAVSGQTRREGEKFGVEVHVCRHQSDVRTGVNVANYEMVDHFDPSAFSGVVLDESSLLKSFMGKTKRKLIELWDATPYRLACTATPSPNDHTELGNHAEFLGVMNNVEMLARWFINDSYNVGTYRLKGHAEDDFWRWVASWAVCIGSPSDIGFDDAGYVLPPLNTFSHIVPSRSMRGQLVATVAPSAMELQRELAASCGDRCAVAASLANESSAAWLIWCNRNDEADALKSMIPDAEEVRGSMPLERKERILEEFTNGNVRVLISKPSITGWGMNWQHCADMAFVSPSYSFESRYQAIRRCWRFGQVNPVNVHDIMSESESLVCKSVARKEEQFHAMREGMSRHVSSRSDFAGSVRKIKYAPSKTMNAPRFINNRGK